MKLQINNIKTVLLSVKSKIDDDCRADEEIQVPSIVVTFSTDQFEKHCNWQSGDNSYSGACYGDPYWATVCLTRSSNCLELARQIYNELKNR